MLNIIVLAAGMSRRMGEENKLLLPFDGSTVIETTLKNILKAELGHITVVVGHEAEDLKAVLKNYPLSIVHNSAFETGMTSSIQTGVKSCLNNLPYMICLSDMILLQAIDYQYIKTQFLDIFKSDEKAIVVPIFNQKRGNPVIFSNFYKNDILSLTYTEGCKPIVQAHADSVHFVEMPNDAILKDMDTKEDYLNLKKIN